MFRKDIAIKTSVTFNIETFYAMTEHDEGNIKQQHTRMLQRNNGKLSGT